MRGAIQIPEEENDVEKKFCSLGEIDNTTLYSGATISLFDLILFIQQFGQQEQF